MRLGITAQKLQELGVRTLAIIATGADRARLYFRFRPPQCAVGADPDLVTHRAYGVPQEARTPEYVQINQSAYAHLARELQLQVPAAESYEAVNRLDGFTLTEGDAAERARHYVQFTGHFLMDPDGIIRWLTIGRAGLDRFPTDEELLAAARTLRH